MCLNIKNIKFTKIKNFLSILVSDSNKVSTKRVIGLICLVMFMVYGVVALFKPFNIEFWIFYVSLCTITIWVAFRFMSSEKILKYDVISKLSAFGKIKEQVSEFIDNENVIDDIVQPNDVNNIDKKD